jgi:hypothetical protein
VQREIRINEFNVFSEYILRKKEHRIFCVALPHVDFAVGATATTIPLRMR